jgi:hypothetical protein
MFKFNKIKHSCFGTFFVFRLSQPESPGTITGISLYSLVLAILMLTWFVLGDEHPANIQPVDPNSRTFVTHNLELERRIRTKLETDAALEAAIDVTAEATKNEATLSGLVSSEAVSPQSDRTSEVGPRRVDDQ